MKHQLLFALAQFLIDGFTAHKTLIVLIIIGMVAGLIAQIIMPGHGHGLIVTALIGIAGCYVGIMFVNQYLSFISNHILKEFVGALLCSCVLTVVGNLILPKEKIPKV